MLGKVEEVKKGMAKELRKLTIEGEGKKEKTIQRFHFQDGRRKKKNTPRDDQHQRQNRISIDR